MGGYNTCRTYLSYACVMILEDVCIVWGQYNEPRTPYTCREIR